jgi:hypothetical protein
MITVFARNFGSSAPQSGQSASFAPDVFPGASWLDSGALNVLRVQDNFGVNGDGLTFATWVKPDWSNGSQGAPAMFMELEAPSQAPLNEQYIARFGYDSETTLDSIFLYLKYYLDGNAYSTWINAPLNNPYNQSVTGLAPGGITNTWNSVSSPGFVHVAVTLDMTTQSWPEFITDISPRAKIFWNGQLLETFENFSSNPSYMNLIRFTDVDPKLYIGPKIWNRAHWQDRTIYTTYPVSGNVILNDYYANGAPSDPPASADFHWNFESGSTNDSNGMLPSITMIDQRVSPGAFPTFDPNQFV